MRLCGISSRFQLLSPCIRQVTHALLTRPPLSHLKWINSQQAGSIFGRGASFDLHVLSTPPAFILSQDQTLVKSVCSVRMTLAIHPLLFVLEIVNDYSFNNVRSENLFWIFRDGCCSIINVLVCCFFNSHINLTYLFMFVNNFFIFFKKSFFCRLTGLSCLAPALCECKRYTTIFGYTCQQLFFFFLFFLFFSIILPNNLI